MFSKMIKSTGCLMLAAFFLNAAADSVIIQYVKSSPNTTLPYQTLLVYQSGKAQLLTQSYSPQKVDTATITLTSTELTNLQNLFAADNFASLDSVYNSGCLACPTFGITYQNKTVRGNTTGGSAQLLTIKTGLDNLVTRIQASTQARFAGKGTIRNKKTSSSLSILTPGFAGKNHRSGITISQGNQFHVWSISGQRIIPGK